MSVRPPLAIVFGGGGPFATAAGMAVASAFTDGGVPITNVPAIGTSGGAVAAAASRAGLDHSHVADTIAAIRLPEQRPGMLHDAGIEMFGTRRDPDLRTAVVRLATGHRTLLRGADRPVATIVAASCALPMLVSPVRVGRCRYIDGGVRSWISADLAPPADHLVVVAPVIAPSFGHFGSLLRAQLGWELRRWKRRTAGHVTVIGVDANIASRIRRWGDLFDRGLASDAHDQVLNHVRTALMTGGRLHNTPGINPDR